MCVWVCVHRLWKPTKGNFAPFGDSEQGEYAVRLSAHGRTIAIRRHHLCTSTDAAVPIRRIISYIVADFIVAHASHATQVMYIRVCVCACDGSMDVIVGNIYRALDPLPETYCFPSSRVLCIIKYACACYARRVYRAKYIILLCIHRDVTRHHRASSRRTRTYNIVTVYFVSRNTRDMCMYVYVRGLCVIAHVNVCVVVFNL